MQKTNRLPSHCLFFSAAFALVLAALQPFGLPTLFGATAPVNVPVSQTLDLTDPNRPTLFLIGYSHLDTQWRWAYPQVIREFLPNTFNENFSHFQKFPHYVFNWTGAGRYKLMKDYFPADFEKIRAAVSAGRWFPNGVAWEETDANTPSVESIIRQLLLGREFFLKEFGPVADANDFILPDCFGFPASLPSILYHCGVRGFSTQKLSARWGAAKEVPFNVGEWIGPDGNSIIAALNAMRYGRALTEDPSREQMWIERVKANGDASGIYADYTYMARGDRGGAPRESSVAFGEQAAASTDAPLRAVIARADLMFNSISDEQMKGLPKYQGDLLLTEHSAGVLTSQAYMKHWNRANELLADAAERASVAAWLLGAAPYPREKLNGAWQLVLRSQMHDILPGTSIPKAYEYSWNDEVLCLNTFAEVLTGAVGAVASGMDTRTDAGAVPLVVYNPLAIDREDVVEATVDLPGGAASGVQVLDGAGKPVPTQLLSRVTASGACHIAFLAKVPSVGFAVFSVKPADGRTTSVSSSLAVSDRAIENARYRVTLNNAGDIASVFDKQAGRELLATPARLAFLNETPAKTPAWDMDWADRKNPPRAFVGAKGNARTEIVERGPVRVALRVTRDAEGSHFDQTISLAAGDAGNRVEIANTIDWLSKGCSLKAEFPLTVSNPLATYNDDLGKIERASNDPKKYEIPSHQWFDLTDKDRTYGVTILTAAKYGSDKPDDNTVRLTLLYSPDTRKAVQGKEQRWQDWGRHDFTYGIYGHAGDWRKGASDWQALRMEQPLLAFTTMEHDGKLGRTFSLLKLDSPALAVRAIKLAENRDQVIVRIQELNGEQQTAARLTLPAAPIVAITEVNGVEVELAARFAGTKVPHAIQHPDYKIENGSISALDFPKYQLRAFALTPGDPIARLAPSTTAPVTLPYNMNAFGYRDAVDNGSFDNRSSSIPAEMISDNITSEGIPFAIGPRAKGGAAKKALNAVQCEGQVVPLPEGEFNRVYLLAAAYVGDTEGKFSVAGEDGEGHGTTLTMQDWTGRIGSWDNRVFEGEVKEIFYSMDNALKSITTGFIKRNPVAWYCDHRYDKNGKDKIYSYAYLFKYTIELPAGAETITLPNNPNIRVLAMTAAQNPAAGTNPARPLYDDFTDRKPIVIPKGWAAVEVVSEPKAKAK